MKHYSEFGLGPLMAVIDEETFALNEDAIIPTIGCVIVNVFTGDVKGEFYLRLNTQEQRALGRAECENTLAWWEKQKQDLPSAYQELYTPENRTSCEAACLEFNEFLSHHFGNDRIQLMGNGPEFDNIKLAHLMQQLGVKPAWDHGGNQSLRTAVWMGRMLLGIDPKYTMVFEQDEIKHHALHDARHEARYLCAIFQAFISSSDTKRA